MYEQKYIRGQSGVVFRISLNFKIQKEKYNLAVIDSSEMYCLSDFRGLHSNSYGY